jgi:hypothetical protein
MAAQVASLEPAATQALDTVDHAGLVASMAAQVASLEPAATQVLGVTVEQTSLPVQSALDKHATSAPVNSKEINDAGFHHEHSRS